MLIKMSTSTRRSSRKAAAASEHVENAARKCRVKKSIEKAQQEEAFKEFVALIGANGGKVPYGAVDNLVKVYHKNGFKGVTRKNLYYRLERSKKSNTTNADTATMVGTTVTASSLGTASSVTMSNLNGTSTEPSSSGNSDFIVVNVGGRKKGSKKVNKKKIEKK